MTTDSGRRNTATRRTTFRAAATLIATAAIGGAIATNAMAAAEHTLAGIRVFSSSSAVLKKFGSPDEVRVGQFTTGAPGLAIPGGTGAAGGPGAPGGGGGYPGASGGGYPGASGGGYPGAPSGGGGYPGASGGGYPGAPSGGDDSPGALPGLSGGPGGAPGEFGGAPGGGGYPGAGGSQSGMAIAQKSSVTWIYDRPDGGSLEFTMSSDGRVVQIHASGFKGAVRTDKGVALGMKLSQVNDKYGYPESQFITGKILTENYTERSHAAFQFYNGRLVGIIVAAVE
ncbi:hypothetical protein CCAX7_33490 [Capsulimonas corticalis]|uniref:Uncharacterized protein n=2 Tax=Capsulimonas corticalis TaxID=2219043 RepID=A0A9N7L5P2_9BACT|nr:hypothetical protein CCAX7_33490 [Capsulimonas corticalis]